MHKCLQETFNSGFTTEEKRGILHFPAHFHQDLSKDTESKKPRIVKTGMPPPLPSETEESLLLLVRPVLTRH